MAEIKKDPTQLKIIRKTCGDDPKMVAEIYDLLQPLDPKVRNKLLKNLESNAPNVVHPKKIVTLC